MPVHRSIIYIINPISGNSSRNKLLALIKEKSSQQNIPYQIFSSVANGDYSFLHPIIQKQAITDVVIAGGDGTINQVVDSLKNYDINFGIIPCGSGNGLALAANISTNPSKALDIIFNNKTSWVDGIIINNHFSCMLCGIGFDAQVAKDFANEKQRGLWTYIKLCLKNFWTMRPFVFDLQIGSEQLQTNAYFISIANSNQFGNHFTITPKASLSDGLLDIIIVFHQNKIELIFQLLKQLAGWNPISSLTSISKQKGVLYIQTEKLIIRNPQLAPLHIDGEPKTSSELFSIEIKKKCFRLIQPAC